MSKKMFMRIAIGMGIIISFLMLLKLPYGVYSVGKFIVFCVNLYLVYYMYITVSPKEKLGSLVLIVMAILYNPIFLIYLKKQTRQTIDIVSGGIFILTYALLDRELLFGDAPATKIEKKIKKRK